MGQKLPTMKKMNNIKQSNNRRTGILKGFSTLDFKNMRIVLLFLLIVAFGCPIYAGHSILDRVDPTFNPQIQSSLYSYKWVSEVHVLPDGKILVIGSFNSYNGVLVGKLVRLNADGSLDTTFNNQTVTENLDGGDPGARILVQPSGKIVLKCNGMVAGGQGPKPLLRVNADGTFDSTFNFTQTGSWDSIVMDSLGRLLLKGNFTTPQGTRRIIRLNDDGSLDNSFTFTPATGASATRIVAQGNRLIVLTEVSSNRRIFRLNEDGSEDASFTPLAGIQLSLGEVQPDNKILYSVSTNILRLNENGGNDNSFQSLDISQVVGGLVTRFTSDGRIVFMTTNSPATFRRYLPNGTVDPSFNQYTTAFFGSYAIQPDDSIVMGDVDLFATGANNFVRLTPGGVPDPTFNPGGTGFKTVLPGVIQSIETYADGKILLGGKFNLINGVTRYRLARLNADSTVDSTFQINTSSTGNYFSTIQDVYLIRLQADGKMIVSGFFDYFLGGAAKKNLVRLNSDGSIDATFDLTFVIHDWSQILIGGQNRFAIYSDGKLMVGTSKVNDLPNVPGPTKLTEGGARDTSFNPTLNSSAQSLYYEDVAIQPDGKIIASGSYAPSSGIFKSFVARFNTDGTLDSTFPYVEEPNRLKSRLALLPSGKILISKSAHPAGGSAKVQRLNSNGTSDTSFNTLLFSDSTAKLNALLVLPTGKIFVGGKFTVTVNGQPGKNLLKLDADGNIEPTTYNVNQEVLCLAVDSEGRLLVGGSFTIIGANGAGATRSYIARLVDSPPQFDYDGDGKADVSVYRPSNNYWYLSRSSDFQFTFHYFGASGDIPAPADYDGDGKTELAVFRPSSGDWWYLSRITGAHIVRHWGSNGDIPLPSDFDGDGRDDYIVYHPANNHWYRLSSGTGQFSEKYFGAAGDKPLVGDFDGDGKSDPAIFRPSTGVFWYMSSIDSVHRAIKWGASTDIPVPADYDGDGKTDAAVYRPSTGTWYIRNSSNGSSTSTNFGVSEDKPIPADYDGDGKADIAVFRPSNGTWYLLQTTAGFGAQQWGVGSDIPTENAFIP